MCPICLATLLLNIGRRACEHARGYKFAFAEKRAYNFYVLEIGQCTVETQHWNASGIKFNERREGGHMDGVGK